MANLTLVIECPECEEYFDVEFDGATSAHETDCPECSAHFLFDYDAASKSVYAVEEDDDEATVEVDGDIQEEDDDDA